MREREEKIVDGIRYFRHWGGGWEQQYIPERRTKMYRNGHLIVFESIKERQDAQKKIVDAGYQQHVLGFGGMNIICRDATTASLLMSCIEHGNNKAL